MDDEDVVHDVDVDVDDVEQDVDVVVALAVVDVEHDVVVALALAEVDLDEVVHEVDEADLEPDGDLDDRLITFGWREIISRLTDYRGEEQHSPQRRKKQERRRKRQGKPFCLRIKGLKN